MTTRRAWIWCAVAGILAFVASWLFGRIPDLKPCGPSGGLGAVLAFEFVRSPADVAGLFGNDPCRSALIVAQRHGLLLDGLWFIPAYTAFLAMAAWASGAAGRGWLIPVVLVAGLSDQVEGFILWSILSTLPGTQAQIDSLWFAVHLKFALLALATAGTGVRFLAGRRGWPARGLGAGVAVVGGIALLRLFQGEVQGIMLAFATAWTTLLIAALIGAIRPTVWAERPGSPV